VLNTGSRTSSLRSKWDRRGSRLRTWSANPRGSALTTSRGIRRRKASRRKIGRSFRSLRNCGNYSGSRWRQWHSDLLANSLQPRLVRLRKTMALRSSQNLGCLWKCAGKVRMAVGLPQVSERRTEPSPLGRWSKILLWRLFRRVESRYPNLVLTQVLSDTDALQQL
jgi:hypothetical protein